MPSPSSSVRPPFGTRRAFLVAVAFALAGACARPQTAPAPPGAGGRIPVLLDSDANNELDDQHAIAYLLANRHVFDVQGITTNRTRNGGGIAEQTEEARRVVRLMKAEGEVPVVPGADGSFREIGPRLGQPAYDGHQAVRFIRERARAASPERKLVLLAIGKLTNVALALSAEPGIAERVRVVWLGSNWPKPGEYNLEDDVPGAAYVVDAPVELDIAVVRYDEPSGTGAVATTLEEVKRRMTGKGPRIDPPVTGRHGGSFATFGDYAVSLFENIGEEKRPLYDMAAVAALKNPRWARWTVVPAPRLDEKGWTPRPENPRKIRFVTDYKRDAIVEDLFATVAAPRR